MNSLHFTFLPAFLTLSCATVGGGDTLADTATDATTPGPALGVHAVTDGEVLRWVWTRSDDDTSDNRSVASYEVCIDDVCVETTTNYLDVPVWLLNEPVSVTALSRSGAPSELATVTADETIVYLVDPSLMISPTDVVEPEIDIAWDSIAPKPLDLSLLAHGVTATSYSTPPTTIDSPVYGSTKIFSSTSTTNSTSKEWGLWQHKTGAHKAGGGIDSSDDTYAWDINGNLSGISSSASNLDKNMSFVAMGFGWATKWAGYNPGTDSCKSVLIDHSGWFTGYLHGATVKTANGDYLDPSTTIGTIGQSCTTNYHLHAVVYSGSNSTGKLKSYNASFAENTTTLTFASTSSVTKGSSTSLGATGSFTNHAASHGYGGSSPSSVSLNAASVYDNTWWTSSNSGIVKVDGNGKLTGVAAGSATISLYYSGASTSKTITVK